MGQIRKIELTSGVYWIEVVSADLRLLCGAPADTVKHLTALGLIVTQDLGSVKCETGPNAILLSDSTLQNGSFSNMAEFPVLQMLYKQGMIIPGHPNNNGSKPLLIGAKAQVEAQMEYIFRGNYGLKNKEELMGAGLRESEADMHMRMKLKFAFGKIKSSDELLDSLLVGNEKVAIRSNVWIERISHDNFKISTNSESVEVNLGLNPTQRYKSPYALGNYKIDREYFAVLHTGQGDGWDTKRPSMSSILMFQGKIYLIDAGPNIDHVLSSIGIGIGEIEGIFHTHAHDDHFAGLTTLMRSDHKIKYYATKPVRHSVIKKVAALLQIEEDRFDDFFEARDLEEGIFNDIGGLEAMPIMSPHPVETTIYVFRTMWEGGMKSFGHFADIVSLKVLDSMVTDDISKPGVTIEFAEQTKSHYHQKLDIKKIDIGGGMIHGEAEDFRYDPTDRLIFAHTNLELTSLQKEIGSGASFGTMDILIKANQDYAWRYAYDCLSSYFDVPPTELRAMLNGKISLFNPETIIIKEGETKNPIYLVLTGNIEIIPPKGRRVIMISAGTLIGEISGLIGLPCGETYRAVGFVKVLRIPADLYLDFVQRNDLYAQIEMLKDNRTYLDKSWLFGEEISYPIQNEIARALVVKRENMGTKIDLHDNELLYLIQKGTVLLKYNSNNHIEIGEGDFFGEDSKGYGLGMATEAEFLTNATVLKIPLNSIKDIPIVRLKILEAYQKRARG
jgi:hemerythrin